VLRLNFVPDAIRIGGRAIAARKDLKQEGYTFDEASRVLRIRHTSSRDVEVQGKSGLIPPSLITFDDPHLAAKTPLVGQYPSGVIDWGHGGWQIGTPLGKFGTFTLALSDPRTAREEFSFYAPRIFAGIDVYNDGDADAIVTVGSPETREVSYTIRPKELRRLRTGWQPASSKVTFSFTNGQDFRFDNLAYVHP
jgi:hypothetical protein